MLHGSDRTFGEPGLLEGFETMDLTIHAERKQIACIKPQDPWTHELLVSVEFPKDVITAQLKGRALDAYVGPQWVGSSEVFEGAR